MRILSRLIAASVLLAGILAGLSGCRVLPSYSLQVSAPHKDVVRMTIYLSERQEPEVYRQIALQELRRIRSEEARLGIPLYEAAFDFHKIGSSPGEDDTGERLARVVLRFSGAPEDLSSALAHIMAGTSARIETTLY